jgi:hypothetical protein
MEQITVVEPSLPGSSAVAVPMEKHGPALVLGALHAVESQAITAAARADISRQARKHQRVASLTVVGLSLFTLLFTAMVQWLIRVHGEDSEF